MPFRSTARAALAHDRSCPLALHLAPIALRGNVPVFRGRRCSPGRMIMAATAKGVAVGHGRAVTGYIAVRVDDAGESFVRDLLPLRGPDARALGLLPLGMTAISCFCNYSPSRRLR